MIRTAGLTGMAALAGVHGFVAVHTALFAGPVVTPIETAMIVVGAVTTVALLLAADQLADATDTESETDATEVMTA